MRHNRNGPEFDMVFVWHDLEEMRSKACGEGFAFFRWQSLKYGHTPQHYAPGDSCCLNAWRNNQR